MRPKGQDSKELIKLQTENQNLQKDKEEIKVLNEKQEGELLRLREENTRLKTEQDIAHKNLEDVKRTMKLEFQETAQKLFKESKESSKEDFSNLIKPLKQEIGTFTTRINEVHGENQKERASLQMQVKNMIEATNDFGQIFKGSGQSQGGFGEVILEKVLESSGLRKGEEFIVQGEGLGLKNEEGGSLKPDATVLFPDKKYIFIDSKVSLKDYYKYKESKTEEDQDKHRKNVVASIYRHIKDLSGKYSSLSDTPDFTLMFFPEEGAFTLALQSDKDLYQKAWKEGIIIIGPTTLYAVLKTIYFIWKTDKQNKNAKEIAKESGNLYNKLVGFLTSMEDIGKGLTKARESYSKAISQFRDGKGNLISRAEKIKELGADTDKNLPKSFSS